MIRRTQKEYITLARWVGMKVATRKLADGLNPDGSLKIVKCCVWSLGARNVCEYTDFRPDLISDHGWLVLSKIIKLKGWMWFRIALANCITVVGDDKPEIFWFWVCDIAESIMENKE